MEGGVEGAFLDPEVVVGGVADPSCDGVAVHRTPGEGLEDQEVERSLEEIEVVERGGHRRGPPEVLRGTVLGGFGCVKSARKGAREKAREKGRARKGARGKASPDSYGLWTDGYRRLVPIFPELAGGSEGGGDVVDGVNAHGDVEH